MILLKAGKVKLPEYTLKQEVQIHQTNTNDPIEFPIGTLIQPFWNEDHLPDHIKEQLKEAGRYRITKSKLIMCLIGRTWTAVPEEYIRTNN
jgi:hypothetical protein